MNLETGRMIPIIEGEELPEGYYPVPAVFLYPPVPAEPPRPHRTVTLENGHKVCPDCQQGMVAIRQPTGGE